MTLLGGGTTGLNLFYITLTVTGLSSSKSLVVSLTPYGDAASVETITITTNGDTTFTTPFSGGDTYEFTIDSYPDGQTCVISSMSGTMTDNLTLTADCSDVPTSNVCFPAKTPVLTNQGPVNIEDIDPAVHTIRNKKIVAITKTVAHDKNLVRISKHALGHLYPEKTTFISQNHKVFCQGQMVKAKHLVNEANGITLVPYNGQVLYNVLLEEHEKMQVNNLIVETLHPEHKVAKLYRILKNVDSVHHGKLIALFNKKDKEHRIHF